jgi:hypothetical protein
VNSAFVILIGLVADIPLPPIPPATRYEWLVEEEMRLKNASHFDVPSFTPALTPDEIDRIRLAREKAIAEFMRTTGKPALYLWKHRKLTPEDAAAILADSVSPTELGKAVMPPPEIMKIYNARLTKLREKCQKAGKEARERYLAQQPAVEAKWIALSKRMSEHERRKSEEKSDESADRAAIETKTTQLHAWAKDYDETLSKRNAEIPKLKQDINEYNT